MPFTLALLPLIAGSLGPDLQYYLPSAMADRLPNSHSAAGAFTIAPAAALIGLVVIRLFRQPLTGLLWDKHAALISLSLNQFGAVMADWLWAVPAIYIGVLLHLIWDSFTHLYGWPVQHIPMLRANLAFGSVKHFEVFRLLQWLSSFIGLGIIALWYRSKLHKTPTVLNSSRAKGWRVTALALIAIVSGAAGVQRAYHGAPQYSSFHGHVYLAVTTSLATFAVLYLLTGIAAVVGAQERLR